MKIRGSLTILKKLVEAVGNNWPIERVFDMDEVIYDGRYFYVSGRATATATDVSDYDRERGYGHEIAHDDYNIDIDRVIEVTDDGQEVDRTDDQRIIEMVKTHMREELDKPD